MGDVFTQAVEESRAYFRRTALHAAFELGVIDALQSPANTATLAHRLALNAPKLDKLLDVLELDGVLTLRGQAWSLAAVPARPPAPIAASWGRLAEVIRSGKPAKEELDQTRYQMHLMRAGEAAAAETVARFMTEGSSLLDAGSGGGTYSRAWLDGGAGRVATLVDRPEVLSIARQTLGERARYIPGDLLDLDLGTGYALALLSNLLHLHDESTCRAVVRRCTEALRPGGRLIVKDFRPETETGRLFALNMAVYTDGGAVWESQTITGWLEEAGLETPQTAFFAATATSMVVFGVKPE